MTFSVVNLKKAAEVMSVSEKTIRRLIARGELPAYTIGGPPRRGRLIRIRVEDLEALLHRIPTAADDR